MGYGVFGATSFSFCYRVTAMGRSSLEFCSTGKENSSLPGVEVSTKKED